MDSPKKLRRFLTSRAGFCLLDEDDSPVDSRKDDSLAYSVIDNYANILRQGGALESDVRKDVNEWREFYLDEKARIRNLNDQRYKEEKS